MGRALRAQQEQRQQAITHSESLELSVFHVAYLRGLFPEKNFKGVDMKNLEGLHIKMLLPKCLESRRMVDWLEKGVYDALKKGFLKGLIFGLSRDVPGTKLLEEYQFDFTYDGDGQLQLDVVTANPAGSRRTRIGGKATDQQAVKYQITRLMRMLVETCNSLEKVPEERVIFMKLTYHPHCPSTYEPPYFVHAAEDSVSSFCTKPFRIHVGAVDTGHHQVSLKVRSILDTEDGMADAEDTVAEGIDSMCHSTDAPAAALSLEDGDRDRVPHLQEPGAAAAAQTATADEQGSRDAARAAQGSPPSVQQQPDTAASPGSRSLEVLLPAKPAADPAVKPPNDSSPQHQPPSPQLHSCAHAQRASAQAACSDTTLEDATDPQQGEPSMGSAPGGSSEAPHQQSAPPPRLLAADLKALMHLCSEADSGKVTAADMAAAVGAEAEIGAQQLLRQGVLAETAVAGEYLVQREMLPGGPGQHGELIHRTQQLSVAPGNTKTAPNPTVQSSWARDQLADSQQAGVLSCAAGSTATLSAMAGSAVYGRGGKALNLESAVPSAFFGTQESNMANACKRKASLVAEPILQAAAGGRSSTRKAARMSAMR